MRQTISCAMIVRDAESTIQRALESVRPHVDELVILDTGSVDGTCEIASRYADVLAGKLWRDHFAEMREEAYSLCSGDWILHLDADDELIGGEHLREAIGQAPDDLGALLLRYQMGGELDDDSAMSFWRERATRRGAYRWQGRIHEVLIPKGTANYIRYEPTWVLHHGHSHGENSLRRNIRLLELSLLENPDDPRSLFYLGRDLVACGETERGREVLERYLPLSQWLDEKFIAQELIAHSHRVAKRYGEAYRADLQLLDIYPMWPQCYFDLAQDCYFLGRWAESIHYCEIGQRLPMPQSNLFLSPIALLAGWMIYQVVALWNVGRRQEAIALTDKALVLLADDPHHLANAAFFAKYASDQAAAPPPALVRR